MKPRLGLVLALLAVLAAACPAHHAGKPAAATPSPITVTETTSIAPYIRGARLTQAIKFDGGLLRLDPIEGTPAISERRALDLWLANPDRSSFVQDVAVVYARATVRLRIGNSSFAKPGSVPRFDHRPVWAILWLPAGGHSCPNQISGGSTPPIPRLSRPALIIAADGSPDGVLYETRGARTVCPGLPETPPSATIAEYDVSVPWTFLNGGARRANVTIKPLPCAFVGQTGLLGNINKGGEFVVVEHVLMVSPPCPGDKRIQTVSFASSTLKYYPLNTVAHGATGLTTAFVYQPLDITYFDGSQHRLPVR